MMQESLGVRSGDYIQKAMNFALVAAVLTLPTKPSFNNIFIISLTVLSTFAFIRYRPFPARPAAIKTILLSVLVSFGFLVIGLLNSSNLQVALQQVEVKMTFLLLPVVFLMVGKSFSIELQTILILFALEILLLCLFCHGRAMVNAMEQGHMLTMFTVNYVDLADAVHLHPGYFSMYVLFAQAICLHAIYERKFRFRSLLIAGLIYLILFNIQLLSRMGIVVQFALLGITTIYFLRRMSFLILGSILLASLGLFFFLKGTSNFEERIVRPIIQAFSSDNLKKDYGRIGFLRYETFYCALSLQNQESVLLGYGTGDVQDNLMACYQANHFEEAIRMNLNAHNEYLQTLLRNGALACCVLIFTLGVGLMAAIKAGNYPFLGFIVILSLSSLTESILSVHKGAVFYSLFLCIFATFSFKGASTIGGNDTIAVDA